MLPVACGFLQHQPPEMLSPSLLFGFNGNVAGNTQASSFLIAPTKDSLLEKYLQLLQGSQLVYLQAGSYTTDSFSSAWLLQGIRVSTTPASSGQ